MSERFPGIRPRPSLWRRLDAAFRAGFPSSCTIALLLVLAAPLDLPGQAELQPAVALACVFFWSLFRPYSMPPPAVFVIGVVFDLLSLEPLGVATLLLLLTHGAAIRLHRGLVRQGFLTVWLAFVLVAAAVVALEWGLISVLRLRLLPVLPALFQFGLTAGLYPALAVLFGHAHRGIAAPEEA